MLLKSVDTKKKADKETYKEQLPWLKTALRDLQQEARKLHIPVICIFEGWDTAGKGDAIQHVTEVLDPRGFVTYYTERPTEEERAYPWMKRFWTKLPRRGQFAIFERSWYQRVQRDRVESKLPGKVWKQAWEDILSVERQLADDGYLILKFWLHISEKQQHKRLKLARQDPFRRFTVTDEEWVRHGHYKDYLEAAEEMLNRTDTEHAPWFIVEAGNKRHRRLKVLEIINRELQRAIEAKKTEQKSPPSSVIVPSESNGSSLHGALDDVDLSLKLEESEYRERLQDGQLQLRMLQQEAIRAGIGMCMVYEGWDAGGKGGSIRRLTATLDPRGYTVVPIGKPTREELDHHYLWRFWKEVPRKGAMTIYDRSWYGRVLVERIEGFCTVDEAERAYDEINEFEATLTRSDMVIVKFWFHISKEEQLARFESRKNNPHKAWKLTDEDWRNREKWDQYVIAVNDMVERTSTPHAPWTIISGDDKQYARVQAIETVCGAWHDALEKRS